MKIIKLLLRQFYGKLSHFKHWGVDCNPLQCMKLWDTISDACSFKLFVGALLAVQWVVPGKVFLFQLSSEESIANPVILQRFHSSIFCLSLLLRNVLPLFVCPRPVLPWGERCFALLALSESKTRPHTQSNRTKHKTVNSAFNARV